MFSERLQVLIDVDQRHRLETESNARGTSVSALVREAIDLTFPPSHPDRHAAAAVILSAQPMEVPDIGDLGRELDASRGPPANR